MITKITLQINQEKRLKYIDWIFSTSISCVWDYMVWHGKQYMIIDLEEEDAVVFRLKFRV